AFVPSAGWESIAWSSRPIVPTSRPCLPCSMRARGATDADRGARRAVAVAMGQLAAAEAPVSVAATVDKRGITIGDPIGLTRVVETDPGYQITDTGVGRVIGEFEVLQTQQPQLTRIQNGRTRYTFRYRITACRAGDLVRPQIHVG